MGEAQRVQRSEALAHCDATLAGTVQPRLFDTSTESIQNSTDKNRIYVLQELDTYVFAKYPMHKRRHKCAPPTLPSPFFESYANRKPWRDRTCQTGPRQL